VVRAASAQSAPLALARSRRLRPRGRIFRPDVIDLALCGRPCFPLRALGLQVDDLGIDLPFFGFQRAKLGILVLTAADLRADAGCPALPFDHRQCRAAMLLRLAVYSAFLK
jgi:hypothetical protein